MNVRAKIITLLSSALVFSVAASGFALLTLDRAGQEIRSITRGPVPLTGVLSQISAAQLEESIRFERALRLGREPGSDAFQAAQAEFERFADRIWTQMHRAQTITSEVIERSPNPEAQATAQAVRVLLEALDHAHDAYARNVRDVLKRLEQRQVAQAFGRVRSIRAREDQISQTLGALLITVSEFTENLAVRAQGNESRALMVSGALGALGVLVAGIVLAVCVRLISQMKSLGGLLPICSNCKKIRDDQGYWNQLEAYLEENSDAAFTHGLCAECRDGLIADLDRRGPAPAVTARAIATLRRDA